ncbi:hypothetical protein MAR_031130 [Mya arenaria]|uniref:DUF7869 domain-containing protein n=1 Tax=Mya arenaria TaxID=6604 RepID=A0ABY7F6V2_MYAAR|nr:hypothetical protein MAR_031130 [Mya arenaria]
METLKEAADEMSTHVRAMVMSMLHDSLQRQGFYKSCSVIHADNCGGKNKNRYVLANLSGRIQMGLHEEIVIRMRVPGHTRLTS